MAIEMRMTMMATTTISSTKVKPRSRRGAARLPFRIARSIGSPVVGFAVNIKDILAPPTVGLGIILIAPQAPVRLAGKRVARDAPEQEDLLILGGIGELDAFYQLLE